ncbi:MAG: two-component system response regulator [Candidatus Hermodarchaeota archaeon]
MRKFEDETGKKAIWHGTITKEFRRWQKGEKIYIDNKERINIIVSNEKKKKWENYAKVNNVNSLSKLIRESVEFLIEVKPKMEELNQFSKLIHNLKERLSSIKGFSHLLVEEHKDELSWEALLKIKEIIDESLNIESLITNIFNTHKQRDLQYDILIIDDDPSTINLISNYFGNKGYSYIDIPQGNQAIKLLKNTGPKLILLDILLPDISGYEVCKKIKTDQNLKNIPVYFITAVPEAEVHGKMSETKADGYFLKPFNISEFKNLLKYLQ